MAGGDSGSGSPSNLPPAADRGLSVSVFSISASYTFEIAVETLFIDGFRSKRRRWHEKRGSRRSDDQTGVGGTVPLLGHATHTLSGLVRPLVRSKCSRHSS